MRSVAVLDGVLVPSDRATIPISDRGFLYGDAVFEILRTYDGALPFAAEHVERAVAAARTLGITDEHTSAESLLHALDAAVRGASLAPGEDAVLRLVVTRGDGAGIDVPERAIARVVVTVAPYVPSPSLANGLVAVTAARVGVIPGLKTSSYLGNVLARRAARSAGADEAVFVEDGALLECAGANLFAVSARGVSTAPDEAGVLPGITRRHVAELARDAGLDVSWKAPRLDGMASVSELFATSSVRGVVPIRELRTGGQAVFRRADWPVTSRLAEAWQRLARSLAVG